MNNNNPSSVMLALHHSSQQIKTCTQPQSICESIEQCFETLSITGFYRLDCQNFSYTAHFINGQYDFYNHSMIQKASDKHSSKIIELDKHLVFKAPQIQLSISRSSELFNEIDEMKKDVMTWLTLISLTCQS